MEHISSGTLQPWLEQEGPNLDFKIVFYSPQVKSCPSKFIGYFAIDLSGAKFYFTPLLLLRYCQHENNLDQERRWGLGINCFSCFSSKILIETFSSFLSVPLNTHQNKSIFSESLLVLYQCILFYYVSWGSKWCDLQDMYTWAGTVSSFLSLVIQIKELYRVIWKN